jgi:2-oxoacid:acceptor oxidoreductase gamma subunit (pyruvate/2-ketoisovalerate family)
MRREVVLTGIGGQGIQLSAQLMARSALASGLFVQVFGSYGGMMRGGNTEATVVVSDEPVVAPPTVERAWSGIVMHHDYSEATLARLRPDSFVVVDSTVFEGELPQDLRRVSRVPATALAIEVGRKQVACTVLLGAFAAITELVPLESLVGALPAALPAYRGKLTELNREALEVGFRAGSDIARRDAADGASRVAVP